MANSICPTVYWKRPQSRSGFGSGWSFGRRLVAVVLLVGAAASSKADLLDSLMRGRAGAGTTIVRLNAKDNYSQAAVLKIGRIHSQLEQRGFFHIGILPQLVLDDVKVEIPSAEMAAAVIKFEQFLSQRPPGAIPVEVRGFSLRMASSTRPILEAAGARVEHQSVVLRAVTLRTDDAGEVILPEATLRCDQTGCVWVDAPPRRYPLSSSPQLSDSATETTPKAESNPKP